MPCDHFVTARGPAPGYVWKMNWRDFDSAEREILEHAPAASRKLYEVRLKLARERLASGDDVAAELAALRRGVSSDRPPRSEKRLH